jgi:hypothetical protein
MTPSCIGSSGDRKPRALGRPVASIGVDYLEMLPQRQRGNI